MGYRQWKTRKKDRAEPRESTETGQTKQRTSRTGTGSRSTFVMMGAIVLLAVLLGMTVGIYLREKNAESVSGFAEGGAYSYETVEVPEEEQLNGEEARETEQVAYQGPSEQLQETFVKGISQPLPLKNLPRGGSDAAGIIEDFYTRLYFYGETATGSFTWYKVWTESGTGGWVRDDQIISMEDNVKYPYADSTVGTDYVKFTEDNLSVWSEPSFSSKLVCQIKDCGTYLHACSPEPVTQGPGADGQAHSWIKVVIDVSREGWVQCDLVTEATGENAAAVMVKDMEGSLPVRALPQYNSAVVTQVRKADTRLYFTGVTEQGAGLNQELCDWYQVEVSNAQKGWVQADFVREIEP